jgi:transcriptional regulator with XRE-family HTH domain
MKEMVREARRSLGLTQSQAGHLFGATLRTWQDWESGNRKPHGSALLLIELACEKPEVVDWLEAKRAKQETADALGELAGADAENL